MERYDLIIVGAGISGLSLAYCAARQGMNTLVLEKDSSVGGAFHTHRIPDDGGDFWLELGAHTCYNSYRNLIAVIEGCGMTGRLTRREKVPFRVLRNATVQSIPSQLNFLELLVSVPKIFVTKKAGLSVADYYKRIVGKQNFQRVFAHAFNSVLSQDTADFPADMLFKKRQRRKDILKSFTLEGGLQSIPATVAGMHGLQTVTGVAVEEVQASGDGFQMVTKDGHAYAARAAALATPAPVAANLLKGLLPDVAARLSGIEVCAVESMGVVVEKEKPSLDPLAGLIATDEAFFSVVSRDIVPHPRYRGFTFHFQPNRLDRDAKLARAADVLGMTPNQIAHVALKENAIPALRVGHEETVRAVDSMIAGRRLLLTGNYFAGVAIEDCVSRSFAEFQRLDAQR
jgi:protoporphyrinogen oxidase